MTIGPLPRNPGLIRESTGGPLVMSKATLSDNGFATTLRAVAAPARHDQHFAGGAMRDSVERFNEHGFFANAGALDVARLAITAPSPDQPSDINDTSAVAQPAPMASAQTELPVQTIPGSESPVVGTELGRLPATSARSGNGDLARPPSASAKTLGSNAMIAPRPLSSVIGSAIVIPSGTTPTVASSTASTRIGQVHPTYDPAASSPVSVVLDTGKEAAAVTIAAHGLTDREADALHDDIVSLLRRHGLALDELKLNGRPLGQGRDRSGS